ncbi:MerR family transcriptional regulator [Thermomicrobium sp.]
MQGNFSLTRTIDEWLAGRPAATRRAYAHDVREFLAALGGELAQLDETVLRRWLATFEQRRLARATVQRKLAAVRSFLCYLAERGYLERDLSSVVPATFGKPPDPTPRVHTTERGRLLATALQLADPRLQLLLWLAGCGCPLPVIARLRWRDLEPWNEQGIALCPDERERVYRCIIPGLIWRSLQSLAETQPGDALVFAHPDGRPVAPRELAETIGWLLDEAAPEPGADHGDDDRLLTLSEVAQRLGLPETTIRYYRDRFAPYIPTVGSGRSRRYPPRAVERLRWIIEQLHAGVSPVEIEAQLGGQTKASASTEDADRLVESVERLSQRIAELTASLQLVAEALQRPEERSRRESRTD